MDEQEVRLRAGARTVAASLVGPEEGVPALFLHGSPGCRLQARRLASAAAARHVRLVAVDRPGCGRTSPPEGPWLQQMVDDVRLVLDELGTASAPALAVSGGTAAALVAASALGTRVPRVVIASGLGLLGGRGALDGASPSSRILAVAARRGVVTARLALGPAYLFSRLVAAGAVRAGDPRLHGLAQEMRETFHQGTRGPAVDVSTASLLDRLDLAALDHPVVAWHGARDRHAPLAAVEALVERLPGAVLKLVEDGDHFVFETHADRVLADLIVTGGRTC